MDIVLEPEVDGARDAVRLAVARARIRLAARAPAGESAWWRAGVDDAVQRTPREAAAPRYGAVRSPRSTRGATRA